MMSTYIKSSFIIGLILTILGCFLPWRQEGDFISYYTLGLRLFPYTENNGGFVVLLICSALIVLIFCPPVFITKPNTWVISLSALLTLISTFHIGKVLINNLNSSGIIGAPTIQIGLMIVFFGSILMLITANLYPLRYHIDSHRTWFV